MLRLQKEGAPLDRGASMVQPCSTPGRGATRPPPHATSTTWRPRTTWRMHSGTHRRSHTPGHAKEPALGRGRGARPCWP